MLKNNITPKEVVKLLNEMLKIDYNATYKLVTTRFNCNQKLADHSTIQVNKKDTKKKSYEVGFMGVLNGMFGVNKYQFGCICYECDFNKKTKKVGKIRYFKYNKNLGKPPVKELQPRKNK